MPTPPAPKPVPGGGSVTPVPTPPAPKPQIEYVYVRPGGGYSEPVRMPLEPSFVYNDPFYGSVKLPLIFKGDPSRLMNDVNTRYGSRFIGDANLYRWDESKVDKTQMKGSFANPRLNGNQVGATDEYLGYSLEQDLNMLYDKVNAYIAKGTGKYKFSGNRTWTKAQIDPLLKARNITWDEFYNKIMYGAEGLVNTGSVDDMRAEDDYTDFRSIAKGNYYVNDYEISMGYSQDEENGKKILQPEWNRGTLYYAFDFKGESQLDKYVAEREAAKKETEKQEQTGQNSQVAANPAPVNTVSSSTPTPNVATNPASAANNVDNNTVPVAESSSVDGVADGVSK